MGSPPVKAEQDGAIRVEDLAEVVMGGPRLRLAEERLIPFEAASHIANPDDRPRAFHVGKRSLFDNGGTLLRRNKDRCVGDGDYVMLLTRARKQVVTGTELDTTDAHDAGEDHNVFGEFPGVPEQQPRLYRSSPSTLLK